MKPINKNVLRYLTLVLTTTLAGPANAQIPANAIQNNQISPTTPDLTPFPNPIYNWSVDQVADGIIEDMPTLPGFVATESSGTISLELDKCYNLTGMYLWNDVNIEGQGAKEVTLNFFDSSNVQFATHGTLHVSNFPACCTPPGLVGEQFTFTAPVFGVNRVDLVVNSVHGARVELREVAFAGSACDKPAPPNICDLGACCFDGICVVTTQAFCSRKNGIFHGAGSACEPGPCEAAGICFPTSEEYCLSIGGNFLETTTCAEVANQGSTN